MSTERQTKRVGTHDGRFHADEVMSTAILKEIYDIDVVRTRDKELLNTLDLIYDVGGGEFDHHDVEKQYRENGTPYAACGLIWRKFGSDVVKHRESSLLLEEVNEVKQHIDSFLIEGIDAADNGLKTQQTIIPTVCISSIVAGFNPSWDTDTEEDEAFEKAVYVASDVLRNAINQKVSEIKARKYIVEAYGRRPKPQLLLLDNSYPWTHILREIDKENEVLFVIYPRDEQYIIQTVRVYGGIDKKKLPKSWAGKRDEELSSLVDVDDAVFCHPARFIAGAKSLETILKMADIAIAEPQDEVVRIQKPAERGLIGNVRRLFVKKRILIRL